MKKHVKIYREYFGYGEQDVVPCELCGRPAADIHHIKFKSRGGTDEIENLMALCREHHDKAHSHEIKAEILWARHYDFLRRKLA